MIDLKSFLNRSKMTKADLCRKIGLDPKSSLLSSYEKGRSDPSFSVCRQLLLAGMTVEELFGIDYKSLHREIMLPINAKEFLGAPEFKDAVKKIVVDWHEGEK